MTNTARRMAERLADRTDRLVRLSQAIHAEPELGFQEYKACARLCEALAAEGFSVETPYAGLETAFRAERGKGGATFALLAEYDALPGIGHACGHNLIATAALAGAFALADELERAKMPGRVLVIGTPAEERLGGKVKMDRAQGFAGIDAAMLAHPAKRTVPDPGSNAVATFLLEARGRSSHAAAAPEAALNALDAVLLAFQGISAWRQHLPERCRVHGVVREGGGSSNVIPDFASAELSVRAPRADLLETMTDRLRKIGRGAALMTGTRMRVRKHNEAYAPRRPNPELNRLFVEAADSLGMAPEADPPFSRASSDFGDVSQRLPASHIYFRIGAGPLDAHTDAFREEAGTADAARRAVQAGATLAACGWAFLTDPAVRRRAREAFKKGS